MYIDEIHRSQLSSTDLIESKMAICKGVGGLL